MGDSYDTPGLTGRAWFRPAVAAWFALLLGGGLWLMPPSVHATLASALGLGSVANNVLILCGSLALLGFLVGWAIAARVASASAPRAFAPGFEYHEDRAWDEEASEEQPRRRRVFSAREDIGEEGIAISAPAVEEERAYEDEFSVADIPAATPEEDFETVYAGMQTDYGPNAEEEAADLTDSPVDEPADEPPGHVIIEDAEYEPLEPDFMATPVEEEAPTVDVAMSTEPGQPEETETPLGDMSLDALLGRLEGAMEAHKSMVAASERAAAEPAPQTVPMARETEPSEHADHGLAEVSDDDPVIAFLRREASRRMPERPANEDADPDESEDVDHPPQVGSQTEAQAALRNALDRLGQVKRKD